MASRSRPLLPVGVLGWILTVAAIMLGAPFWFDLLGKLTKLRAAGAKPDERKSSRPDKKDGTRAKT